MFHCISQKQGPSSIIPVQQLSSCGGSAEESSDNTTANIVSDGNTTSINQGILKEVYRQPAVISRNKPVDSGNNTVSGVDPRTLQRQNTRTIRIHRQRRLSLAGKGGGNYLKNISGIVAVRLNI